MAGRAFDTWFLALADPGGKGTFCFSAAEKSDFPFSPQQLIELAGHHGVLPAVARSLRRIELPPPAVREALALAEERLLQSVAFSLRIRKQLAPIAAAFVAAGLPALVLKGPEFADRLYAEPSLRPFTDLDFLLPREAIAEAGAPLAGLGYRRAAEPRSKYPGQYAEEMWLLDDPATGAVELHWDLVNSPPLRRRCSVGFHDLAFEPPKAGALPRATPAALLVAAAVHAAMSHRFDRLQPLADVCQAARGAAGPVDAAWLAEAAARTGAAFALATALRLAAALFREPACSALVEQAPCLSEAGRLSRRILTPRAVLHPKTLAAGLRRQLYRELLKRH